LILKKISKIGATRCQLLKLKCTKIDFDWGSPRPRWERGAYSAPPDPIAVFKGSTSKGKRKRGGKKKERKGEGENNLTHPLSQIPGYATERQYKLAWI